MQQAASGPSDRALEVTRQALASQALCQLFQVIAGGTGSPSTLAKTLGKSKHAVSLQLAQLREAALVHQVPHPSGDARRKRYVPAWDRVGEIFATDHAVELSLFAGHVLDGQAPRASGAKALERLVVTGTGRLLATGAGSPSDTTDPAAWEAAEQVCTEAVWGFQRFFEAYLAARSYPSLRQYLRAAYQELVREADRLPDGPALTRFMRFQAAAFGETRSAGELLTQAVGGCDPPSAARRPAARSSEPCLGFEPVGRETADGAYVLRDGAEAIIQQGLPIEVQASYVHRSDRS